MPSYQHVAGVITSSEAEAIEAAFAETKSWESTTLDTVQYTGFKLRPPTAHVPSLEQRAAAMFPDLRLFCIQYQSSRPSEGRKLLPWHTGFGMGQLFVGRPRVKTLWVPLQDITSQTGGQVWYYDGPQSAAIDQLLVASNPRNSRLQEAMVETLVDEFEAHATTQDCVFGDGLMFDVLTPHKVDDRYSGESRRTLSLRFVEKGFTLDEAWCDYVENVPQDELQALTEVEKLGLQRVSQCEPALRRRVVARLDELRRKKIPIRDLLSMCERLPQYRASWRFFVGDSAQA